MKIHLLSDLHTEFGSFSFPATPRDLLILAGDTGLSTKFLDIVKAQALISPVALILGNHEYYGGDFDKILRLWQEVDIENLHFLENSTIILNSIRIIGCTLWTDMDNGNEDAIKAADNGINDYFRIKRKGIPISPLDTMERFKASKQFLIDELAKPHDGSTIVLTHHLPSYKSVMPEFVGNPLNPAFATELSDLIESTQPELWIHGHTHSSLDYFIGNTRVICNPRGYLGIEANPNFDPELIIEL